MSVKMVECIANFSEEGFSFVEFVQVKTPNQNLKMCQRENFQFLFLERQRMTVLPSRIFNQSKQLETKSFSFIKDD
ncbi:hypothetical protein TNIN_95971 [Trichonephila inaurata madagascariensis]|uniref:Uncharacterized protein n=1 Tax=Trichonephila inaurata madagascariensis TaxID=2747483 RepID=A0A8X6I5R2_9ARAC|nr:hypothetical protein TNIN_95971 [Trichonephila inaurata madagascariensis]